MDILTGEKLYKQEEDFSSVWRCSPKLGLVKDDSDFLLNGSLGSSDSLGEWDSVDRLRFKVTDLTTLTLNLDSQVIAEVVKFDSAGNTSVVGSIEYGSLLQLELTPGRYGLSFFVEGDSINYSVAGNFQ
jgi:hypothetical protein